MKSSILLSLLGLAWLVPAAPAQASPWTLSKGTFAARSSADVQWARKEWLINGRYQVFPLQGRYFGANLRVQLRYGVTDRLEVGLETALSHVNYNSDEFYFGEPLVPNWDQVTSNAEIAANITSLDRRTTGLSDIQIYARYRVTPLDFWRAAFAPEIHLKVPSGYAPPRGTFADDDFAEGVADDVTLGDGQLDITALAHAGFVPVGPWFLRVSAGFRLRLFGPGQQVLGSFKTGVRIANILLPYGEIGVVHSVNEGKVVGLTFATAVPERPAAEFTTADLEVLEYRLDRSELKPRLGFLIIQPKWEVDLSWSVVAWGRNVAQTQQIAVGVTFRP
jgi:hypothetical protein